MQSSEGFDLVQELMQYRDAAQRGAKHSALLHFVRCGLIAGEISAEPDLHGRPLLTIARRHPAPPFAFLGCFTATANDYFIPLKQGVNRIGRNPIWGDHVEFPAGERLIEARQWLFVCRAGQTLIADDHSTDGSVILPADALELMDPDFCSQPLSLARRAPTWVELDWAGNIVHELREGDVLVTKYAAFIYGHVPTGAR